MLRLRVHHRQRVWVVECSDRDGNRPLVVGASEQADLPLESRRLYQRHCAIFLDEAQKRWVVQDGNTGGRTRVNGVSLPTSRTLAPLLPGFEITLGDGRGAPRLLVEMADLDRPGPLFAAASNGVEFADDERAGEAFFEPIPERVEAPVADEPVAVATGSTRLRRVQEKRIARDAPLRAAAVAAIAASVGGLVGWVVRDRQSSPAPDALAAVVKVEDPVKVAAVLPPSNPGPPAIVVPLDADPLAASLAELAEQEFDPAGRAGYVAGVAPSHPARAMPAWRDVVEAERAGDLAEQILACRRYLARPEEFADPLRKHVADQLEEALDAAWWQRIATLVDREVAALDQALDAELALRSLGPDAPPDAPDRLRATVDRARAEAASASGELEIMKYDDPDRPRLADEQQINRLRLRRDAEAYARWREEVVAAVATTGQLPWETE